MISPRSLADWIGEQITEIIRPTIRRALPAALVIHIEPIKIRFDWIDEP